MIRKEVHLSESTVEDFDRIFPKGSLSWVVDRLLEKFVAQYKRDTDEYVKVAAEELKQEIAE